jgi:type I restriction-modification system DNA methylase subunit
MVSPVYLAVKEVFETKGLPGVFQEVLGWDSPTNQALRIKIGESTFEGQLIASLIGTAAVAYFNTPETLASNAQRAISIEVGKRFPERLVGFESKGTTAWLWPKRSSSGSQTYERIDVPSAIMPTFFAQRLAGLQFTIADHTKGISPLDLKNKLRGAFDTTKVTKKFYEGFQLRHKQLAAEIKGLPEDQTASYASVLLNRLMFIYFLQKKEFLNSDPNYLRTSLTKLQALNKKDSFYSFYRDLLLELFFQGLNNQEQKYSTPEIAEIIGKVPYVNGGIFEETETEKVNDIEVPDSVFESIFSFFDSFTWHLDTRPTGNPEEINPEVIGYIFEQYINFTSNGKKENGAYYTKQDVTGYMVGSTLAPRMLEILIDAGVTVQDTLKGNQDRYLAESQLHGWDVNNHKWLSTPRALQAVWDSEPENWNLLDEHSPDPDVCLPGESWAEMFHRRDKLSKCRAELQNVESVSVSDLVRLNLNLQLLATDTIDSIQNPSQFEVVWSNLVKLSVIDPTCGSGAFLFAAMELLEDFYSHMLDKADEIGSTFSSSLKEKASTHANRRYFVRKQAALNNLYGTDLMPDAIETAKLRIFLALAACLEATSEIEPLPDLDFNIKVGNLIVGLRDEIDSDSDASEQLFSKVDSNGLGIRIEEYKAFYKAFLDASEVSSLQLGSLKDALAKSASRLRDDANAMFANLLGLQGDSFDKYLLEKRPFHWFIEFPQVFSRGGFDVIVGNPPYVRMRASTDRADFVGYRTSRAPDLYAICYERAISLLSNEGRMAFITPINLAFSDDFTLLREIISSNFAVNYWSTFDQLPQGLFEGAAVRNTIVVSSRKGEKQDFSTGHQIFTAMSRSWLFDSLEYFKVTREPGAAPLRGGMATEFLQELLTRVSSLGVEKKSSICIKATANYWIPIYPKRPPILDLAFNPTAEIDPKTKEIDLGSNENAEVLISTISGKLGFLFWQATGDGFDVIASTFLPLRRAIIANYSSSVISAAESTVEAGLNNTVVNMYRGRNYISIRWAGIRSVSDKFDKALLETLGLGNHWRSINIAYRQVMKANESRQMGQNTVRNRQFWNL